MPDDELKQEWTINDICEACNYTRTTYDNQRKAGKVPSPDRKLHGGYIWYRRTILPYIEKWLETHPLSTEPENQPNQP